MTNRGIFGWAIVRNDGLLYVSTIAYSKKHAWAMFEKFQEDSTPDRKPSPRGYWKRNGWRLKKVFLVPEE